MSRFVLEWSQIRESLVMALTALRTAKLRSVLTLLGIVLGIFSIICVMTADGVMRNSIEEGLTQLGANTFQVQKFPVGFEGGAEARRRARNRKDITYEQACQVRDRATLASSVGLEVWDLGTSCSGTAGSPTRTFPSGAKASMVSSPTTGTSPRAAG